MRGFTRSIAVIFVLVAFVLIQMTPMPAAAQEKRPIKIGVSLPKAGFLAAWGISQEIGVKLAEKEINDAGGILGMPVKFIIEDSASKQEEAVRISRKFEAVDKVLAIIGPFSSQEAEVSYPLAMRSKVPMISATASKVGMTAKFRPWGFSLWTMSDRLYGPTVKEWAKNKGVKKVGIIYETVSFMAKLDGTVIFPQLLKEAGVEILDSVSYHEGDLDMTAQITRLLSKPIDGIVASSGNYGESVLIMRQARRQGFKGHFIGGAGVYHPRLIPEAGEAAEGAYVPTAFWLENPDPRVQAFVRQYKEMSGGKDAESTAAHIYDTIYILKKVMEEKKITNDPKKLAGDRMKIQEGLSSLTGYPGITGKISINKEGEAERERVFILEVKSGRFERM